MLTLYYVPDTCALASHIALEEAGAEYTGVRMSFSRQEQKKPEFLRINPKARVPALVTEYGALTETPAILLYLCQLYPAANMAPLNDPFELAQVLAFNSYLCSTAHVAHAHRMRGERWADDPAAIANMQAMVPRSVGACYQLIETEMLSGPYVTGKHCTIADFHLFTLSQWLENDGVDINSLPKVAAHRELLSKRDSVIKALAQEFV